VGGVKMYIIIPVIAILILSAISVFTGFTLFTVPTNTDLHFGLITICSIFAGFLYTNYSLLLDFSMTDLATKIKNTNIIPKRNRHITCGIICSIISIISGLLLSIDFNEILSDFIYNKFPWLTYTIYCTEIIYIFMTIILFLISLFEMKQLINSRNIVSSQINNETINKVKQQLKKEKTG
jgi:hypothetical protein